MNEQLEFFFNQVVPVSRCCKWSLALLHYLDEQTLSKTGCNSGPLVDNIKIVGSFRDEKSLGTEFHQLA